MAESRIDIDAQPFLYFIPFILCAEILLSFLIAVRPSFLWCFAGFCLYTFVNLYGTALTLGNVMLDYTIGSAFANNIFTSIHFLWLSDPVTELRHGHVVSPYDLPILRRMYLAMCLKGSVRGVGWHGQVKHLPPSPTETGWHFTISRLAAAFKFFLLFDVSHTYLCTNPLFSLPAPDALPITAQGYLLRCLNIFAWVSRPYALLNILYYLLASSAVASGFSEASHWPGFFGDWKDAYTVRNFWGRIWHQELRRFTGSIGQFCSRSFGYTPGTWPSSCTQLLVAFIISGVIHTSGDAMIGAQYIGYSFPFFLVQALAILFESVAMALARRVGLAQSGFWNRVIGYIWVSLWFSLSVPLFTWQVDVGLGASEVLPMSPSGWILRIVEQTHGVRMGDLFPVTAHGYDTRLQLL